MRITEIAFVAHPVTDVQRARDFYENVLGLELTMNHEIAGQPGKYWIEYEIAGQALALSNAWEPTGESGPTVAFEVEDYDAAIEKLKANNVTILMEKIETPVCTFGMITDPDGNPISIHKRKPDACSA